MNSSPVVLLLKVADGDETSSAAQGELVLRRGPLDAGGGAVDTHQDQRGLPQAVLQRPHVGVAVGGTRHDAVGLRGPVDSCAQGTDGEQPAAAPDCGTSTLEAVSPVIRPLCSVSSWIFTQSLPPFFS